MPKFQSTLRARRSQGERSPLLKPIIVPAAIVASLLGGETVWLFQTHTFAHRVDWLIQSGLFGCCVLLALLVYAQSVQRKRDEQSLKLFNTELTTAILALDDSIRKQQEAEKHKQEIVGMVSHELRSPLSSLLCTLEMLQLGVFDELPGRAVDKVEASIADLRRLLELINDLLDLEKMEAGKFIIKFRLIKLSHCLTEATESLQGMAESRKVCVNVECADDHGVWSDHSRLTQVVVNLLSNAIKYSPPGEAVDIVATDAGPMIKIEIKDRGPGISAEDQARIFDKFEQVESTQKQGTSGLGLAICKEIVTALGGSIGVSSELNKGTCFWLLLPKTAPQSVSEDGTPLMVGSLSSAVWLARFEEAANES